MKSDESSPENLFPTNIDPGTAAAKVASDQRAASTLTTFSDAYQLLGSVLQQSKVEADVTEVLRKQARTYRAKGKS